MSYFSDKTAVVTGGASGIGRALVEQLSKAGANVVVADIEQRAIDETCRALGDAGRRVVGWRTDVTDESSLRKTADDAYREFGAVHFLFNNAGVGLREAQRRLWTLTASDWSWGYQVNVFGIANGIRVFVPRMIESGHTCHVINTSSSNGGLASLPTTPIYASSKSAVTSITEVLNYQLQMDGAAVRAHLLFPGPHLVNTNILSSERNRPAELGGADTGTGYTSMAELAEKAGLDFQLTESAEVAEYCLRGVENNDFWIMPESDDFLRQFERRAACIRSRRNPHFEEHQ